MRFLEQWFPLVVVAQSHRYSPAELRDLTGAFDRLFARGERCAILSVAPDDAIPMGPKERKALSEWLNQPELRERAKRVCVGSATVVANPVARLVTTALLWLWTPPTPFRMFSTPGEALDSCLSHLSAAGVPLRQPAETIRREVRGELQALGVTWASGGVEAGRATAP